ncbi:uncharacterized protein VTP21DRAFT_10620 [Calcarisporiella thermophila]|uniref:uncharacterized protein n=1 Tax=Calcarisporiella thermophila TaxID=911321 RepID=UPI003743045A
MYVKPISHKLRVSAGGGGGIRTHAVLIGIPGIVHYTNPPPLGSRVNVTVKVTSPYKNQLSRNTMEIFGCMAKWIRRLTTNQEIPGSTPGTLFKFYVIIGNKIMICIEP